MARGLMDWLLAVRTIVYGALRGLPLRERGEDAARTAVRYAALAAAIVLAGPTQASAASLKAVASFSILGDMVGRVGGERVEVRTIVGPGGDAHVYEPTPADAKAIAGADVVFVNGLGFEGWMERLVTASGYEGRQVVASDGIAAAEMPETHEHEATAGHAHDEIDPHAWQNVANAQVYVRNIAKGLCAVDAQGCSTYETNAAAYEQELAALDAEIKAAVVKVPSDRRVVITSHEAFGYFARAYGIRFLAPEGVSTESEASAQDVARLITQIRQEKAAALFVEVITDPRLVQQIGRETGVRIGGELYSDALSESDGPAPSYIAMMRHNVRLLTNAMAGT